MNTKLKLISICSVLNLIPMIGYAENLACPLAEDVMAAQNPATGDVTIQITSEITLTGQLPLVNHATPYSFANVLIPIETTSGQKVACAYSSNGVMGGMPIALFASTSSTFSSATGTWQTSGSYSFCQSTDNDPSKCQFVKKTVANAH